MAIQQTIRLPWRKIYFQPFVLLSRLEQAKATRSKQGLLLLRATLLCLWTPMAQQTLWRFPFLLKSCWMEMILPKVHDLSEEGGAMISHISARLAIIC